MPKQCSHPDCTYNVFSKGLCQNHWRPVYGKPIKPKVDDIVEINVPDGKGGTMRSTMRITSVTPNKPLQRTKPIKMVSDKQAKINAAYKVLRDAFMKAHPVCMAGWSNCTQYSEQVHHMAGRTGDLMLDSSKWVAVCPTCHQEIELAPLKAKKLGLSKSRLDKHSNE